MSSASNNSNNDLSDLSYGQKVIRSILGDDIGQMNFYSKDAIKFRKYLEYSVLSDMSNTYSDGSFSNSSTKIHFCPDGSFLQSISSHINISGDYIDVTNAGDTHIPGYWDIATLPNNTFIILFYSTHSFILKDFPNAATSYDAKDPNNARGFIGEDGKLLYFNTPKLAGEKLKYSKQHGHQGLIIWELTQDADYNNPSSILRAINDADGNTDPINSSPIVTWDTPASAEVFEMTTFTNVTLKAKATDSDGTVASFVFKYNNTEISATKNGDYYTADFLPTAFGEVTIIASAIDDICV